MLSRHLSAWKDCAIAILPFLKVDVPFPPLEKIGWCDCWLRVSLLISSPIHGCGPPSDCVADVLVQEGRSPSRRRRGPPSRRGVPRQRAPRRRAPRRKRRRTSDLQPVSLSCRLSEIRCFSSYQTSSGMTKSSSIEQQGTIVFYCWMRFCPPTSPEHPSEHNAADRIQSIV